MRLFNHFHLTIDANEWDHASRPALPASEREDGLKAVNLIGKFSREAAHEKRNQDSCLVVTVGDDLLNTHLSWTS